MRRPEHPLADTLRAIELMLGTPLLVVALVDNPIRWAVVALALLLLGVITLDTIAAWTHRSRSITAMSTTDPNVPDLPDEEELPDDDDDETGTKRQPKPDTPPAR